MQPLILKGNIIFTPAPTTFSVHANSFLVIEKEHIQGIYPQLPEKYRACPYHDYGNNLIIPGFCDMHTHAPQLLQCGLGMDEPLLKWLAKYTFPEEGKFHDLEYARTIYRDFIARLIASGTTSAAIFGTIHLPATNLLCDLLAEKNFTAFVGKVNMDRNAPDFLLEDTQNSVCETEKFIQKWKQNKVITPIITPRFAISCTAPLLQALGELAQKYQLPVQSHLDENEAEIAFVKELFPNCPTYDAVYKRYHLLGDTPTLMAHCIHVDENIIANLKAHHVYPVHCPLSNINLSSGIMPARRFLNAGINLTLGSDIGAGNDLFIPRSIVSAIQLSKIYQFTHPDCAPLSLSETFYLATKGGGKMWGKNGSLESGYLANCLVIKPHSPQVLSPLDHLAQFLYYGTPKDIQAVYLRGKLSDLSPSK